ncbi:MAG: hypothetical protein KGS72_19835 [Cyanobacteria bacterium REEB67]|nr:hypothetical protein [Cyanobacteria bacterium REEB67]
MKKKIAIATALLGCQLFTLAAGAVAPGNDDKGHKYADQRINALLLAPLSKIAQGEPGGMVPNGLPYVPPDQSQASGGPSSKRHGAGRGRHSSSRKHGSSGHRKRSISSGMSRGGEAAPSASENTCCAPSAGGM